MERLTIKEATKYKVEWCCEVIGHAYAGPDGPHFEVAPIAEALGAMHNAQASYLKRAHGASYRGPGEMFAEAVNGNLRITMRWVGSKAQAHMLARRDPAFHATGEEPKPLMIGGTVVSVPMTTTLVNDKPIANLESVGPVVPPIPASEPEPSLEMSPPADVVAATTTDTAPPVVATATATDWPKDVFSVRRVAEGAGIETSDIKGKGSRKRIIARLEAQDAEARRVELAVAAREKASGSESETPQAP